MAMARGPGAGEVARPGSKRAGDVAAFSWSKIAGGRRCGRAGLRNFACPLPPKRAFRSAIAPGPERRVRAPASVWAGLARRSQSNRRRGAPTVSLRLRVSVPGLGWLISSVLASGFSPWASCCRGGRAGQCGSGRGGAMPQNFCRNGPKGANLPRAPPSGAQTGGHATAQPGTKGATAPTRRRLHRDDWARRVELQKGGA